MPPTIALLVGREPEHRHSLHRGYVDAVWAVGAVPVVLPPPPVEGPLDAYLEVVVGCAGVLLTGGGDLDPTTYGEAPRVELMSVDPERDRAEVAATQAAVEAGRPVLGICRGIQLLAVAHGGTLHQDLVTDGFAGHHWEEERQHERVHAVEAKPLTLAAAALDGAGTVNSIHHQAVRDPGSLVATAWSDDGVIEAVERDDLVLGIQWHPERLTGLSLAPFRWLTERAA